MKKKRLNKKFILVLLILFISVGFAYLTSNLSITGLATIKRSVWDVHFENIVNENEDVLSIETPAQITNNRLRVEFEVSLDTPGEEYSFYVDVVNKSTFDVALDTLTISGLSQEQEAWIIPTVTYSDGISLQHNDILKENSLETLRVSVKYKDDLAENDLPTTDNDFTLTVELKYNQADSNSRERNHLEYITRQTPGVISVGDEIAIASEHFYVVSSDEDKTVLLAKYNLLVGSDYSADGNSIVKTNLETDDGYGMQNANAEGFTSDGEIRTGTIYFSGTNYYSTQSGKLKSEYGKAYGDNYIYDPDQSVSLQLVRTYGEKIKQLGLNILKERLITIEELKKLGCIYNTSTGSGNCNSLSSEKNFINYNSYWTATAGSSLGVVVVRGGNIWNNAYASSSYNGLRPVIEINSDYLLGNVTLSFDTNGGEETFSSRLVRVGSTYQNLPEPTREGYTFLGWNGKNLFNPVDFYNTGKDYNIYLTDNKIISSTYPNQQNVTQTHFDFKNNTQYTLSYDWKVTSQTSEQNIRSGLTFYYDDGSRQEPLPWVVGSINNSNHKIVISNANSTVESIASIGWQYTGSFEYSNIQVEEGTEATTYEPFYVINGTTVVQNKSHTLKAIWKEN